MSNYNRDNNSGSRRYSGGSGGRNDSRNSGPREMHKAVCSECGKDCQVPFKPTGDKPIYCSNCFEKRGGGSSQRSNRGGSGRSDHGKADNTSKQILEQLIALNAKLDRILKAYESSHPKETVAKTSEAKKVKETKETKKVAKKASPKAKKPATKKVVKKEVKKPTE